MIAITKRLRLFRGVPDSKDELEKFRQQARATLNKPYDFHPMPQTKSWELFGSDPTHGFFKPFGKVTLPASKVISGQVKSFSALARVKRELASLDWRRVSVPIGLASLALAMFLLWQTFATMSIFQGVISQNPVSSQNQPVLEPVGEVVPPGTELEPGGPYTGTGSTQPPSTNLNGGGSSSGGGGGSGTVNTSPTCPAGHECNIPSLGCTYETPCKIIHVAVGTESDLIIIEGTASDGTPCTIVSPCVVEPNI